MTSRFDLCEALIQHTENCLDQQFQGWLPSSQTAEFDSPFSNLSGSHQQQAYPQPQIKEEYSHSPTKITINNQLQTNTNLQIQRDKCKIGSTMRQNTPSFQDPNSLKSRNRQSDINQNQQNISRNMTPQIIPKKFYECQTRNFLRPQKQIHIKYLQDTLGHSYVNSFPFIKYLKKKNGISLQDYESLYKIEQFYEAFTIFFQEKVLYRQLMLTRCSLKIKKVNMRKLHLFQKAFRSKHFSMN